MSIHQRFTPSGKHTHFDTGYDSLSNYIEAMRQIIRETRCDLAHQNDAMIIETNAPRQNTPSITNKRAKQGILLIHGLMDSACIMSSLYQYFDTQGYKVVNLLLPGHGTRPGDLLDISLESWLACVRFAIAEIRREVSSLTVVGFSLGAALTIYMKQTAEPIDKLLLFAPAIQIKNRLNKLTPLAHRFKDYSVSFAWVNRALDLDYAKYQSLTVNAVYQVSRLINLIHKQDKSLVDCPCMSIMSFDDETISSTAAMAFVESFSHPQNHIWLYSNHELSNTDSVTVLPSHYPDQNILHFSHTALTIAPHHPHYGENGDFRDFGHYRIDNRSYQRNKHKPIVLGAVSYRAMKHNHLRRLHYNPDFEAMMERVDAFLAT